jgi:putative redox protein
MSIVSRKSEGRLSYEIMIGGRHRIVVDEPTSNGGDDLGPNPYDLFDASLVACTSLTLMLYAQRKTWPLEDVRVTIDRDTTDERQGTYRLARRIELVGALDDAQRQRLLEIADRCPIHRLMHSKIEVTSSLV